MRYLRMYTLRKKIHVKLTIETRKNALHQRKYLVRVARIKRFKLHHVQRRRFQVPFRLRILRPRQWLLDIVGIR